MPIYEYKCQQCGLHVEKRQNVSDEPLTVCEKCHGRLEKQWSLSGFQLKGEGWYVTDYAGKSGKKADKNETTEKSSSSESTSTADSASKPTVETPAAKKETVSKPSTE